MRRCTSLWSGFSNWNCNYAPSSLPSLPTALFCLLLSADRHSCMWLRFVVCVCSVCCEAVWACIPRNLLFPACSMWVHASLNCVTCVDWGMTSQMGLLPWICLRLHHWSRNQPRAGKSASSYCGLYAHQHRSSRKQSAAELSSSVRSVISVAGATDVSSVPPSKEVSEVDRRTISMEVALTLCVPPCIVCVCVCMCVYFLHPSMIHSVFVLLASCAYLFVLAFLLNYGCG